MKQHNLIKSNGERSPTVLAPVSEWPAQPEFVPFSAPIFRLNKILVPVDFSTSSKEALAYAGKFSAHKGGRIILLHVVKPRSRREARRNANQKDFNRLDDAERKLLELAQSDPTTAAACDLLIQIGNASREIVNVARRLAVDLIIIAAGSSPSVKRAITRGTAELVVRHAPCPVLVVRQRRPSPTSATTTLERDRDRKLP